MIVACLGSSSTAGRGQAFDWIGELSRRPGNQRIRFYNFGVGGDLAYNALERLPKVVACRPDKVVVWLGGNDVLALVSRRMRIFFRVSKHLPCQPSPEWFRENMEKIAQRLKAETRASVALCSLPPMGEDPSSADPFQSELNRRIEEYGAIIRQTAEQENCAYLGIYEAMLVQFRAAPGLAFTRFRLLPFYRDAFRVLVRRKSPDAVAEMNGWRFHTDGVHLNSRGAMIAAELVQQFIDG